MSYKINLIGAPKVVMSNPNSSHGYFAWPTVTRLQNGKICVGASGYRVEHICPFGTGVITFSEDNGESYSDLIPIFDTPLDDRDVGLTPFGKSGLIATSFNNTIEFQRENMPQTQECFDYINSVSPKEEEKYLGILFRISNDCGNTFGEIYKSPVSSPHGPIELKDGTVLWVGRKLSIHNHIYAYTLNTETAEMTFRGDLGIYKYEEFKELYCYEPYAIQLPDGKIICHLRVENAEETIFTLYQTESLDNGKTWSKPRQIIGDQSGAPSHILRHSSGILIAAISHRAMPCGIHIIFSEDNGKTWVDEQSIFQNLNTDDLGYPSTIEMEDGSLLTVFYSRETEEHPALILQQKWYFEK